MQSNIKNGQLSNDTRILAQGLLLNALVSINIVKGLDNIDCHKPYMPK